MIVYIHYSLFTHCSILWTHDQHHNSPIFKQEKSINSLKFKSNTIIPHTYIHHQHLPEIIMLKLNFLTLTFLPFFFYHLKRPFLFLILLYLILLNSLHHFTFFFLLFFYDFFSLIKIQVFTVLCKLITLFICKQFP